MPNIDKTIINNLLKLFKSSHSNELNSFKETYSFNENINDSKGKIELNDLFNDSENNKILNNYALVYRAFLYTLGKAKKNINFLDNKIVNRAIKLHFPLDKFSKETQNQIKQIIIVNLKNNNIKVNYKNDENKIDKLLDLNEFKYDDNNQKNDSGWITADRHFKLRMKKKFKVKGKLSNHLINKKILTKDSSPFLLNIIGQYSVLSFEDEKKLIKMLNSKNPSVRQVATNRLVNCNLRLIYSIANKYQNHSIEITDLFNEGITGLYKAIEKFDSNKFKNRFSTYATWWIRQAITRAISEQSRIIRIPVHMIDSINLIFKKERELLHKNAYLPTTSQIAKEIIKTKINIFTNKLFIKMGFDHFKSTKNKINKIKNYIKKTKTSNKSHIILEIDPTKAKIVEKMGYIIPDPIKFKIYKNHEIEMLRVKSQDIISLEKPINDSNDETTMIDFISEKSSKEPESRHEEKLIKNELYKMINAQIHDSNDQQIFRMRAGLLPYSRQYTVNEIAQELNIARDIIRQIYNKCLNKINNYSHNNKNLFSIYYKNSNNFLKNN